MGLVRRAARARLAAQVIRRLRRAGVADARYHSATFSVRFTVAGDEVPAVLRLDGLLAQRGRGRRERIDRFVAGLLRTPGLPQSWDEARPLLRPVLRGATTPVDVSAPLSRPALPFLSEFVVVDHPDTMTYVAAEHGWGVDADAFSSKYTSIFLPIGVVVAILSRRSLRARLREPGPYVACVVAALVFVPVLLWNAQHEWISFVFQLKHGLAKPEGSVLKAAWRHEGDFFGGQAGLASPILFIMLGIATFGALRTRPPVTARRQDDARFVLAVVALVSFGFFVYSALRQRVEPNWPAPAYIPAIAVLATATWSARGEKWLRAGVIFAGVLSVVIYVQGIVPILPLPPRKDPIARAFGWREMTQQADAELERVKSETGAATWLAGDRYQEASVLAFYTPSHPRVFATNQSGRPNQYDLWPRFPDVAKTGDNLVIVVDDSEEGKPQEAIRALSPYFVEARRGPLASLRRGTGEIGTRRVWTLVGWRGGWPTAR